MSSERTDNIPNKIQLLHRASQAGRHDLALSLAASIRDSLAYERQTARREPPHLAAETAHSAGTLPRSWTVWAEGWAFFHAVTLFETVGIARTNEPVHIRFAVSAETMTDPWREVRVARVNARDATLEEIPSQVLDHLRSKSEHECEVAFHADVPMHGSATYLILFGNPNAELPRYQTDLAWHGEGYGLKIENRYYAAQLSSQMGQLERLTSKREHGLELYAGGKGHGEPPTIDWAHDYVDAGHFQKFRMRNWAACPNWEVSRGPICARVRRWGFPHSPIHPLFTPARIHIDQTYSFYARVPLFFKEGTMEVVQDVSIAAMRDDEWVLSGYSFDEMLWIDRQGRVHEGQVPADQANDLWGVGFFHRTSRDAMVALWLKHEADGFPGLQHSGSPTLHYDGHGQLWSRYPANEAKLNAGTVFRQRNAYLMTAYSEKDGRDEIARLRHQLVNPLEIRAGEVPKLAAAQADGQLARPGETEQAGPVKRAVWAALREVKDEQLYKLDAGIVDLGYVYDLRVEDGVAKITVTMPHRGRPVYDFLGWRGGGRVQEGIRERVQRVAGIRDVVVEFTWEPAWNVNRISEACRAALGLAQ